MLEPPWAFQSCWLMWESRFGEPETWPSPLQRCPGAQHTGKGGSGTGEHLLGPHRDMELPWSSHGGSVVGRATHSCSFCCSNLGSLAETPHWIFLTLPFCHPCLVSCPTSESPLVGNEFVEISPSLTFVYKYILCKPTIFVYIVCKLSKHTICM